MSITSCVQSPEPKLCKEKVNDISLEFKADSF